MVHTPAVGPKQDGRSLCASPISCGTCLTFDSVRHSQVVPRWTETSLSVHVVCGSAEGDGDGNLPGALFNAEEASTRGPFQ